MFEGGPQTTGGTDLSLEERVIFNESGDADGQCDQPQINVTARVRNQIVNTMGLSKVRELQDFLRDLERYINRF